jgi:hypothetical protein
MSAIGANLSSVDATAQGRYAASRRLPPGGAIHLDWPRLARGFFSARPESAQLSMSGRDRPPVRRVARARASLRALFLVRPDICAYRAALGVRGPNVGTAM